MDVIGRCTLISVPELIADMSDRVIAERHESRIWHSIYPLYSQKRQPEGQAKFISDVYDNTFKGKWGSAYGFYSDTDETIKTRWSKCFTDWLEAVEGRVLKVYLAFDG